MKDTAIPIIVRAEQEGDGPDVRRVNLAAFEAAEEADLVDLLRSRGELTASSVALIDGNIVGHAALSPATIGSFRVLVLAPVAVLPDHQGIGVGQAVVRHVLKNAGDVPVSVLGDPAYYSRFGFTAAEAHGIEAPFPVPPGALQVLNPGGVDGGVIVYASAFAGV